MGGAHGIVSLRQCVLIYAVFENRLHPAGASALDRVNAMLGTLV